MRIERTVELVNEWGNSIEVPLAIEGDRESTTLKIDGVQYHFERIPKEQLIYGYQVDDDPDYQPQTDTEGYCYVLAPFSK